MTQKIFLMLRKINYRAKVQKNLVLELVVYNN